MSERTKLVLVTVGLWLSAGASRAETLDEGEAVRRAMASSPTLQAAKADLDQAVAQARAEQGRYRPSLLADATGASNNTPSLSTGTTTGSQLSQSLTFGVDLAQTFSWGTSLDLRLENVNSRSQGPLYAGSTDIYTLGPGYDLSAKLTLTQPLLRGFGEDVGLATVRDLLLAQKEAQRAASSAASEALSGALQAYWELWYDQRAVVIQREALAFATQQRDEAAKKRVAGSLAEVDVLTFETRVAELEQTVLAAEVTANQQAASLAKAIGQQGLGSLEADLQSEPQAVGPLDAASTVAKAKAASYAVSAQRIALERAETALRSAGDATRARLDVKAWVKTEGLGNQSMSAAFDALGRSNNVSGNVGLSFELPLSSQQHEHQVGAARAAVTAAKERLAASELQVQADTATELETLRQAARNVELARRTADVSARNAEALAKKYTAGSATALEVREAEDSLRKAKLSVERERVNAQKAAVRVQHLEGELLARWSLR